MNAVTEPASDISKALAIEGWMTQQELEWLASNAKVYHRIIEIGSFKGRSTRALGDHTPGWVIAIDTWNWANIPFVTNPQGDLYDIFCRNLSDLIHNGKVKPCRINHRDLKVLPGDWLENSMHIDEYPDMVFIDGSHEIEDVRHDILVWKSRVMKGGMLCGHDANDPGWPGVDRALKELVPDAQVVSGTNLWFTRTL